MPVLRIETGNKNNTFYDVTSKMYDIFTKEQFDTDIVIEKEFEPLMSELYKKHGQECNVSYCSSNIDTITLKRSDNVIVGFSGGLDSAYLALRLRDIGYNVTLMHLKGLNKSYPKEDVFAERFAREAEFDYVELQVRHVSKQFFIDNPLKNQLILSLMLDYGIENDISNFALGADWCTKLDDSKIGMTITDSIEVNNLYWDAITKYIENAELVFIDDSTKKYERLKYILDNHAECLNNIYSCISPNRFNQHLHNNNEKKFGIDLLDGRCGSCYKCCMEIILLTLLEFYDEDSGLIDHCWKIMSDSKNSHRKDLFDKKIPIEQRIKNLMNYGS